ncbi:MAG TPA: 3-phosphoshikimate 1-carboxyvinyltransferase [Anaerohalosphaeraceae bacterium]|nr:3-phosphoshikimate 1-carboxyvinyltransferase [Anaerohalosphaeraceae bacterium]HPP56712.1 3-phosphoshikimate 1-carboxyvinyltransferase [Anaerohalosphaeraceae bacterium]
MKLQVHPSGLSGIVSIPGSKSHTIRAVAIASLASGKSRIRSPLVSGDTLSAVSCYQTLGAQIDASNEKEWIIKGTAGKILNEHCSIDVGNSGTTLRLAMGSASLASPKAAIAMTGDEQIQARPIGGLLQSLKDLGADGKCIKNNGCAPVEIRGTLKGGQTSIECFTSQFLSSLLLACPLAEKDSQINVLLLNEPDYARMTLDWLDRQGIRYENNGMKQFFIPGRQKYTSFDAPIPADFSSATFFLCAGALVGRDITLTGLDFTDSQPDKAVVDYLKQMGAHIEYSSEGVTISKSPLKGIDIDMNRTPDALPAMAVTAAFAEGTTRFLNVPQARKKETDRIACMAAELKKLGADVEELPDGLIVHGGKSLHSAHLDGRGDHRIVMALSLAGMVLDGCTVIDTAEAMNVTFPTYVSLMQSLGARMNVLP